MIKLHYFVYSLKEICTLEYEDFLKCFVGQHEDDVTHQNHYSITIVFISMMPITF